MINESSRSTIKKKLGSKLLLLGGLILLILLAVNFVNSWQNNQEINQEINGLETEINQLGKDNFRLAELIKYLNSTAYVEEKARTDLGLKKEGEETVVISDINLIASTDNSASEPGFNNQALSNPQRWWHYFFAKK